MASKHYTIVMKMEQYNGMLKVIKWSMLYNCSY